MKRAFYIYKLFLGIFFKDRFNLFMIFFFNAFLMIIFGVSLQDKYNLTIDVGVTNLSNDAKSVQIVKYLAAQPKIVLKNYKQEADLSAEIKSGKLVAGVVLKPKSIKLIGDPSRKMWMDFLKPVVQVATIKPGQKSDYAISTVLVSSRNLRFFDFFFPGMLIFSIMQIGLSGGIMLLVQRTNGSLKRLQITPLKKWEFLVGYVSCYLCIMLLQAAAYIALAYELFNYSFSGSWADVILIMLITSLFFVLLGILLCNLCKTVENGNNFNRFFTFPASFLCGVFIPVTTFPVIFQKLALVHPLTYLVALIRDVANYHSSLADYQLTLTTFVLLIITTLIISIYSFKWKEKI